MGDQDWLMYLVSGVIAYVSTQNLDYFLGIT